MKNALAIALLSLTSISAYSQDVGVSIGVPGFYGRIEIGDGYPQPQVVNRQPVYVQRGPEAAPPVYLRVPPDHQRNWRRYCGQYGACGQPVYFVQDNWYRDVYSPRYREVHADGRRRDDGRGTDDHRGDDRREDDRRGDHRGDDRHDHDGR